MVERESQNDLTAILKAMSDPTRRAICTLLAQHGPMRVTDLARHFEMSLNSVSKHIKALEAAEIVSRRTEWREHLIELKLERLRLIDQWFKDLRSIWEIRLDALETLMTKENSMSDIDTATELTLTCERFIPAPREALFDAWLNPAMLSKIMRPMPSVKVTEATADARVGGRFRVVMTADGKDMPHEGTYKTINRPSELAFTWESAASTEPDSTVTLHFTKADGGTNVSLQHIRFPSEEIRDNHNKGWTHILKMLAEAV